MKIISIAIILLALLSSAAIAQYVMATHYQYSRPYGALYPSGCNAINVISPGIGRSPAMCYQEAMRMNLQQNRGFCFQQQSQKIRDTCYSTVFLPQCVLEPSFEKVFNTRSDCLQGVNKMCTDKCKTAKEYENCRARARIRCSYIGRYFV